MKLAYGVVSMGSHMGGRAYVVWSYDLDKPREQRKGLPQGAVVDMIGVYKNLPAALEAAHREMERAKP